MTTFDFGDVLLVDFPETATGLTKRRPALVVLDIGDADIVLAPLSTKSRAGSGDCHLRDWSASGLLQESWVRLAKATCLSKADISRSLGKLSDFDRDEVVKEFQELFNLGSTP